MHQTNCFKFGYHCASYPPRLFVGFALLEEAKGQLTKTMRKNSFALIFSVPSFIGPSEERADMPK